MALKRGMVTEFDCGSVSSEIVCEWKQLGRVLKVPEPRLHCIDLDYQGVQEKAYQMLLWWRNKFASQASYAALADGLKRVGKPTVAAIHCCA